MLVPVDCCQVLPRSSVTAPGKLMPAVSSSLAITRPVGSVMMSTSGVLWVCPAKSSGVLCQVLPPSVENRTIAGAVFSSPPAPSDVEAPSPLVTTHNVPSGPVVIRGSVHGTPGEIFWTLTLDQVVGAAWADAAPAASPAMTMSTVPSRRAAVMTDSPLERAGSLRLARGPGRGQPMWDLSCTWEVDERSHGTSRDGCHRYPRRHSRGRGDNGNTPPLHGGV